MNRHRRAGIVAAGLTVMAFSAPAWAQIESGRREVVIATATPTGNYFSIGNAICRVLQRQGLYLESGDVTLLGCGASASSGSLQNVEMLRARAVDFALVQSDVLFNAYTGAGRFDGRRVDQLRSLLSLNQEPFQVLAGRGTNVSIWSDLKSKKVNLGPSGTTAHTMFRDLFAIHAVNDAWLGQALTLPVDAHIQELCEGNIEVLGQATGVPNSGIAGAIRRCGANLVSLDTPQIRKYAAERPYYAATLIPKGTYAGQVMDVRTFGVLATLVATADTSETAAYSIVRAIFEGLPELKAMQPALKDLASEQMIKDGLSAPLHPGALRYYRERGWMTEEPISAPVALTQTVDGLETATIAAASAAATVPVQVARAQALPVSVPAPGLGKTRRGTAGRGKSQAKGRGTAGPS
jgi:uncharacterized protein